MGIEQDNVGQSQDVPNVQGNMNTVNARQRLKLNAAIVEGITVLHIQGCEAQIKAKEVQKYKVQNKVTYAEAIKQVKGPQGGASVGVVEPSQYSQQALKPVGLQCDVNKDTLIVDKANFVFFMAKVINLAMQEKYTRSERIKIVVEAAREYLDIKDVTGEMVQEEFNRN